MTRSFRIHVSNYAWSEVLATVAGLISFPILTRLLTVADYGTMNLVASALGLSVALGKLGIQHAALRTHAEVQAGRAGYSMAVFDATVFWGMAAAGTLVMALAMFALSSTPDTWWGGEAVVWAMLLASPLILVRVMDSALSNRLRAQEASGSLAIYGTLRRYAALLAVIAVLWGLRRDLTGFYAATVAVEWLALAALMLWVYRSEPFPRPAWVDRKVFATLAAFGVPMLVSELSTVVLTMSDRYIIQMLLGAEQLGIYAASANMCDYLRSALLGAMVGAAYPRCMRLWEEQGPGALTDFLRRFMHAYVGVALFMVALMGTVGADVMAVLASERYRAGGQVTAWIMAGMAVQTVLSVAAVGIYLSKRTRAVMVLVLVSGLLSIAANWLLVPLYGIRGAGYAALAVFLSLAAAQMILARREAPVVVPWRSLALFGAIAALAAWAAASLPAQGAWWNLVARSTVLFAVYGTLSLMLDPATRSALGGFLRRA